MVPRPASNHPHHLYALPTNTKVNRVRVGLIALIASALLIVSASFGVNAVRAGGVYDVPPRIDASGRRDVSRQLNAFIASVPNGSVIRFKRDGTYRLGNGGVELRGRRNLTLIGRGAKLKSYGCDTAAAVIQLRNGTFGTTIRNFVLAGSNRQAGTRSAHRGSCEHQAGVAVYRSNKTVIEDVTIRRTNGDCVYVAEERHSGRRVWSDGLVFRDSLCKLNGRMGVAIVGGRDVLVARNRFDAIAMYPFDIEPNHRNGGGANIRIRDNRIGRYTIDSDWSPYFFAANGAAGDDNVRNVTVARNRVTGGTLRSVVRVRTRRNINFRDNVSTVKARGPVLFFQYVRGLRVTGNRQPLRSGSLVSVRDSTDVTVKN